MPKYAGRKVFSGVFVIEVLEKKFGFKVTSQKGSHVKLTGGPDGKYVTVVPLHKELAQGTLRGALELAHLTLSAFREAIKK